MTSHKTSHNRIIGLLGTVALGGLVLTGMLTGCGKEEEPVVRQVAPPPPPPPPAPPPVISVADIKAELRIDDRVMMLEEKAPPTTEERKAVLQFFDAFARGDDRALARLLSDPDRRELDRMVESGQWREATKDIDLIDIQTGNSPRGKAALAYYEVVDGPPQAQLWYYGGYDDQITFEAAPTPPGIVNELSGADWITAWHRILQGEMELANRPDMEVDEIRQILDSDRETTTDVPSAPRGPGMPSPGNAPTRPPSGPPPPNRLPGRGVPGG